jgi:hypothetical protein
MYFLEVNLDIQNIKFSDPSWRGCVRGRFNNLSEHFIRGALLVLKNLFYDATTYKTNIDTSQWNLIRDGYQKWDDLLFYVSIGEYYDESKFDNYYMKSDVERKHLEECWKLYVYSRTSSTVNIKRYTAKIHYSDSYISNVIHFSNVDYLSGIMSANRWITNNTICSIHVYDNFKLCQIGYIYHDDLISERYISFIQTTECTKYLIKDIWSIIYEYYINVCSWEKPREKCLTRCDNKYCFFHLESIRDRSSLKCEVVLTPI